MRKMVFLVLVTIFIVSVSIPLMAADSFEDNLPIRPGMKLNFIYIVAHFDQANKPWKVSIEKSTYPDSVTYTWVRSQKDKPDITGTRILTDLSLSRNFNPFYRKGETKATSDTAPWISLQVLKELRDRLTADNFREGGSGAVNWAATSLNVKEKVIFPVMINGKAEALHAFRLNKGMVVWNNLQNPLVLEYEPLAVPLFTSVTGWKLVSIEY